ncbi:MAG: ribonucleoside-diphosphate reductase subunit alpha [Elusimicrobia bacterium]|nr:ribonucleoside-diphosphate reductase subunit alpha [Elusimicrobiota bacterium]
MQVRKRDGSLEPVDVNKIVRAVARAGAGLENIDGLKIATKTIGGLYDGATTKELDNLSIQTSALLIAEEPEYSRLAARLLSTYIMKEVENQDIHSFSQSIGAGVRHGLISEKVGQFVQANSRKLNDAIEMQRNELFEYFGLRTVYDRYLLKNPETREVIEAPQYFFMRVACGLADTVQEAVEFYNLISRFEHMPSSPTLFNSGTKHPQMSSCYLLDSPVDDLEAIYNRYTDIALLSKFSGGIGVSYSRVRARGSLIRSTNGQSNGIIPWLKTLDSSVVAVNQGGKRKGACAVYLETWHADIEEFLELRDNTGDPARRAHNLHLAHWIPDLFMKRAEEDGVWSLFDPKTMPQLTDLYGKAFEEAYLEGEEKKLFVRQVKARELYARMMKALAETGNGWMNWKDASNLKANQTGSPANVVHSSNLCTEIIEVTSQGETAVCNLGSINLSKYVEDGRFDFVKLAANVRTAVKYLDRVIDINFYPTKAAKDSNAKWRPVGLGVMGVQDAFFLLGLPFDSAEARELSRKISEEIYFHALSASVELAGAKGPHLSFPETKAAKGVFQFELWGVTPSDMARWEKLRAEMTKKGLRNSLLLAIAPTATIASIVGAYEATEPQISNLFKRETLSGEFLQVNKYLCLELKKLGLWNEEMRARIMMAEGSIQDIIEIPEAVRATYRTVWEIPMRSLIDMAADRGAYIDQSQSLNLFMESPNIGKLSSMYMYAWKKGLKTSYYLRSRPATKIAKTTIAAAASAANVPVIAAPAVSDAAAVACSLENPESCEACQ